MSTHLTNATASSATVDTEAVATNLSGTTGGNPTMSDRTATRMSVRSAVARLTRGSRMPTGAFKILARMHAGPIANRTADEIQDWAYEHELPYIDDQVHFPDVRIGIRGAGRPVRPPRCEVTTEHYRATVVVNPEPSVTRIDAASWVSATTTLTLTVGINCHPCVRKGPWKVWLLR